MKKSDHELINLFRTNPDEAMAELIEQYTGLTWSIASKHLSNVEDIKECVNETFAEFYRRWESFDSSKGTLSAYLGAISEKRAITKYQKNKVHNQHEPLHDASYADSKDAIDQAEWKAVLESAVNVLSADEQKIIQMKYYENMTVKEIADALGIPYETVKKRHQRSIGKLKKALIGLLIFVLISVLAACAYMVLRYFGVVPGYGINVSEEVAVYALEEPVSAETPEASYVLEDAFFMNGVFQIKLTITQPVPTTTFTPDTYELSIDGVSYTPYMVSATNVSDTIRELSFDYDGIPLMERSRKCIDVAFSYNGVSLPFTLVQMDESTTEHFSTAIIDNRGLLAVPKLRDSHMFVEIHPLNQNPITILPSLVRCVFEELDPDVGPVTVTDSDGNVTAGVCTGYSPFSDSLYYDWFFEDVGPGTYTLHVPYVYETIELPKDLAIHFDMKHGIDTETVYEIPGGSLRAVSCEQISPDEIPSHEALQTLPRPDINYWVATLEYESDHDKFQLLGFNLKAYAEFENSDETCSVSIGVVVAPEPNQISYLLEMEKGDYEVSEFTLIPSQGQSEPVLYRRWDQEFDLTFTVKE